MRISFPFFFWKVLVSKSLTSSLLNAIKHFIVFFSFSFFHAMLLTGSLNLQKKRRDSVVSLYPSIPYIRVRVPVGSKFRVL
jgi:hypothetical protein